MSGGKVSIPAGFGGGAGMLKSAPAPPRCHV